MGTFGGNHGVKPLSTSFSDPYIRNLKTPGRYTDPSTTGLNLQVKKNGGKYWTVRYVAAGKRQDLSLGSYPTVSLKIARIRAIEIRTQLNKDQIPQPTWRPAAAVKPPQAEEPKVTFRDYAAECLAAKRAEWRNEKHAAQWSSTIDLYANPIIGDKPIADVEMDDVLKILEPIWRKKTVTATRLRGRLEWVFASATTRKLRTGQNPAVWKGLLETLLAKPNKIHNEQHHAALHYDQLPNFFKQLQQMNGVAALALEFLILNANRTGEVVGGLRSEVSSNGIWTIPASRMKMGKEHRVPLGTRSIQLLQIAKSFDPNSDYMFSYNGKPLSNMAMLMLLRRKGYDFTVHGFRSSFRDWIAEETDHSAEVAEKALAHTIPNKSEAAYRRGDLLEPRRRLMQDWETYCLTGQPEPKSNQSP